MLGTAILRRLPLRTAELRLSLLRAVRLVLLLPVLRRLSIRLLLPRLPELGLTGLSWLSVWLLLLLRTTELRRLSVLLRTAELRLSSVPRLTAIGLRPRLTELPRLPLLLRSAELLSLRRTGLLPSGPGPRPTGPAVGTPGEPGRLRSAAVATVRSGLLRRSALTVLEGRDGPLRGRRLHGLPFRARGGGGGFGP